jgi:DNA-directed RNA polymerase subunit A'
MYHGFSFGIDDEDIPKEAVKQIQEINKDAMYGKESIASLIDKYEHNELELLPGRSSEETLELRIMQILGKVRDEAGDKAGLHLGIDNSAVAMAVSGARGSMLNLAQMAACVGQQSVRGARIQRGYSGRTLPHFKKGGSLRSSTSSTPSVAGKVSWTLLSGLPSPGISSGGW